MESSLKSQAPSKLVFITQVASVKKSKEASTLIRKHVMRDIGKSRRKVRRHPQVCLEVPDAIGNAHREPVSKQDNGVDTSIGQCPQSTRTTNTYMQPQYRPTDDGMQLPALDRTWTGRMDPFVRFPVELNHRTRELVDQAFDDRYINIGPFRDACLPVGLMDEAAFHQVLSNALLNISCRRTTGAQMETYDAIRHHALAILSINERIHDIKTATSDGFIGAVVGFMCYHSYTGNLAACKVHRKGVDELIRLRGGVETLDSNKLVRTLLGWSDVGTASIDDEKPRYPLPHMLLPEIDSLAPCDAITAQRDDVLTTWSYRFPDHMDLLVLMGDLLRFNNHLLQEVKRIAGRILSNGEFGTGYLFPLLHRVLSLAGDAIVAPPDDLHILQACRLGCTLYLAEIRRLFGINGVRTALQTKKLQYYLQASTGNWEGLGLMKLWCLAMGGMEAEEEVLRNWYSEQIRKEGYLMGWNTVVEIQRQMEGMLWFPEVHSPALGRLYQGPEYICSSTEEPKLFGKWKPAPHLQCFG